MTMTSQHSEIYDPILAEVRRCREEMAREANYDLHVLCERLRALERQYPERMAASTDTTR